MIRSVCVFAGASDGLIPVYRQSALELGEELAAHGVRLVYGGGTSGLMGALAQGCLNAGGEVVGVIPEAMVPREGKLSGVAELHIVQSMHERKAMMERLSDAFIAMPGRFGTFEEICEIITWQQLGLHRKPVAILNLNGYYDALLGQFDRAVEDGLLTLQARRGVLETMESEGVIALLEAANVPEVRHFLWPDQT